MNVSYDIGGTHSLPLALWPGRGLGGIQHGSGTQRYKRRVARLWMSKMGPGSEMHSLVLPDSLQWGLDPKRDGGDRNSSPPACPQGHILPSLEDGAWWILLFYLLLPPLGPMPDAQATLYTQHLTEASVQPCEGRTIHPLRRREAEAKSAMKRSRSQSRSRQ